MLLKILSAILQNLGVSQQLIGLIMGIKTDVADLSAHGAVEPSHNYISDRVFDTLTDLESITYGLNALHVQLTNIKTVVDTLQVATNPVVLPTIPPTGYGAPTTGDIADIVWNTTQTYLPSTPADALQQAGRLGVLMADADSPFIAGWFRFANAFYIANSLYPQILGIPTFDPTDILITEDLATCLARQNPLWTTGSPWSTDGPVSMTLTAGYSSTFNTIISEPEFQVIKNALLGGPPLNIPPVWPGLALVTLGTPVAISTGFTVTGPMDGVLVDIATIPSKTSWFDFNGSLSYRNIGALSFQSDNSDEEFPQSLGFELAVYCPKTMMRAANCLVRSIGGVTGTVTPWVITP